MVLISSRAEASSSTRWALKRPWYKCPLRRWRRKETDAQSRLEPTDRVAQIGARSLDQQVKVIRHQAIRMDYEPETLNGFFKGLQKPLPLAMNWITFVAAGRDMILAAPSNSTRIGRAVTHVTITQQCVQVSTMCQVSRVDHYYH